MCSCKPSVESTFVVTEARSNLEDVEHQMHTSIIEEKVDSLFRSEWDNGNFVGAGVSIILGDKIAYEKGVGYRNFKRKQSVDSKTVFRIGSLSKSLTGTLSAILVQEGGIQYDTKVRQLIPEFTLVNDTFTNEIEFQHLLSHTAGFPYHSYTNLVEDGLKMDKIIDQFKSITNLRAPGEIYSYQNAAFAISGEMMSRAYESPVTYIFEDKLFNVIGMHSTSADYQSVKRAKNVALPHQRSKSGWTLRKLNQKYYNAIPAGGVNTTTEDMSKFLTLVLGQYQNILSDSSLNLITAPIIRTNASYRYYTKWPNFKDSFYGLGWRIHTFAEEGSSSIDTLIHHGGMVNAYRSEMAFHKKEGIGICVLFNSSTPLARDIIPKILNIVREARGHTRQGE